MFVIKLSTFPTFFWQLGNIFLRRYRSCIVVKIAQAV